MGVPNFKAKSLGARQRFQLSRGRDADSMATHMGKAFRHAPHTPLDIRRMIKDGWVMHLL